MIAKNDPDDAQRVNALLPGEIAETAKKHDIKMVHISTDAVFDGQKGNYSETEIPNPLSVYARTKRDGEVAVLSANPICTGDTGEFLRLEH